MELDQQWHGYRRGHQRLGSTVELPSRDQDLIDKLSDASGSPRPGERFDPYLTIYPLPSGQFHVVAKTWQDLTAPRSGTVFTRSLLVPIEVWRTMPALGPLLEALLERDQTDQKVSVSTHKSDWPKVDNPNLAPLVEALFLERGGPIAAFGLDDAETISGRLLEALWPSRRSSMAICTYALGPRQLPDRDFDLVFAPDGARSRFAKWEGRRISASSEAASPRHEWTPRIVDKIFHDPHPSLRDLDELGVLALGGRGDGSSLRLALLWSDLKRKAATSPVSILGMFDILNSLGRSPWSVPYLADLTVQSLAATEQSSPAGRWQNLQLLVRKSGADIPMRVVRAVFKTARQLAFIAPEVVVGSSDDEAAPPLLHLLRPAVARGLADLTSQKIAEIIRSAQPSFLVSLMAENPQFASTVTRSLSELSDGERSIKELAEVASGDMRAARRFAGGVSRGATSPGAAPLLKVALTSSARSRFGYLAATTLSAGGKARVEVLEVLLEVSRSLGKQDELRDLALNAPIMGEGDWLLLRLATGPLDSSWLVRALEKQRERLDALLLLIMPSWSAADLRQALSDPVSRTACVEAALGNLPSSGAAFVAILEALTANDMDSIALLRLALPKLSNADRIRASVAVLNQILAEDPARNEDLLATVLAVVEPDKIILAATATNLAGGQVGRNIASIAHSTAIDRFVSRADMITRRLGDRRSGGYGQTGYDAWAKILRHARHSHPEALVRSADTALDYAMARPREPAGGVAAAAFPVVHARLKKNSLPDIPFNLITAVFYLPIVLFSDWDRAKAARHGIVDMFLRSDWNPVELLRAGVDAGIPRKILGYLVSKPGGPGYLRRIEDAVMTYPPRSRADLSAALADFRSEDPRYWAND